MYGGRIPEPTDHSLPLSLCTGVPHLLVEQFILFVCIPARSFFPLGNLFFCKPLVAADGQPSKGKDDDCEARADPIKAVDPQGVLGGVFADTNHTSTPEIIEREKGDITGVCSVGSSCDIPSRKQSVLEPLWLRGSRLCGIIHIEQLEKVAKGTEATNGSAQLGDIELFGTIGSCAEMCGVIRMGSQEELDGMLGGAQKSESCARLANQADNVFLDRGIDDLILD